MNKRIFTLSLALFLFNVLCNTVVAFAAFGYVPATKDWKWDRAWNALDGIVGGIGGALFTILVVAVIAIVIVKAVNGEPNRTFRSKVGLVIALLAILVMTGMFAEDIFNGSAVFFGIFAAIFAVETFVEHRISKKLIAAKAAKATAEAPVRKAEEATV